MSEAINNSGISYNLSQSYKIPPGTSFSTYHHQHGVGHEDLYIQWISLERILCKPAQFGEKNQGKKYSHYYTLNFGHR